MKQFLSHLQPTVKSAVAFLLAFLAYLAQTGKLDHIDKITWADIRVAFVAYLLSILVPARDPNANKDPNP